MSQPPLTWRDKAEIAACSIVLGFAMFYALVSGVMLLQYLVDQ